MKIVKGPNRSLSVDQPVYVRYVRRTSCLFPIPQGPAFKGSSGKQVSGSKGFQVSGREGDGPGDKDSIVSTLASRSSEPYEADDRSLINLKRWQRGQKVGPEIVRYQLGISCPNLMARPIS
jgi:hypothetical protein